MKKVLSPPCVHSNCLLLYGLRLGGKDGTGNVFFLVFSGRGVGLLLQAFSLNFSEAYIWAYVHCVVVK